MILARRTVFRHFGYILFEARLSQAWMLLPPRTERVFGGNASITIAELSSIHLSLPCSKAILSPICLGYFFGAAECAKVGTPLLICSRSPRHAGRSFLSATFKCELRN